MSPVWLSLIKVFFQLRYLQTLNSISAENNSTIVFPVPIDTLAEFMSYNQQHHQQQLPYNPNWGSPQPPNWTQQQQQNLDGPIPPAPTHKPPPPLKVHKRSIEWNINWFCFNSWCHHQSDQTLFVLAFCVCVP